MERIYLRVSLTPDCNYSCLYCSPEGRRLTGTGPLFSPQDLLKVARVFQELGAPLYKVRFTGGEPLLVDELPDYMAAMSSLGVEVVMTTNGSMLVSRLNELLSAGLKRVNISLDSLDDGFFRRLTGAGVQPVLRGVDAALEAGLTVKLNSVLMKSFTLPGAPELVEFGASRGIEVRFIELMPLGPGRTLWKEEYVPGEKLWDMLAERFGSPERLPGSGTAVRWRFPNGAVVGFIDPVSHPFCASCDRVRLDHAGVMYHCLRVPRGVDVMKYINDYNMLSKEVASVLARKGLLPHEWNTTSPRCIGG